MDNKLTLGSLFDGSGGFTFAAILTGIAPIWASEIEPFPIRVTTKRLPNVEHLGDVYKINGYTVPAVDIITAGFCCQDLSVAGKRAGLHGKKSGIFFQIIRIIREMREATGGKQPKVAVLENVAGMYSSNHGHDFLEILNALVKIKDKTAHVPMPEKGKWTNSGEIMGNNYSLAWRTYDAQFWGVAQRRRRCYLVVDFTGESASKILFDETRLRGNPPQGGFTWETTAGDAANSSGNANCILEQPIRVLNDQGGLFMDVSEEITGTLRANEKGHQPIVFEPGAISRVGGHYWQGSASGTLRADMGDNQLAVAVENKPKTLKIRAGCPGGGKGPLVQDNISATLSTGNDQTVFVPTAYGISSHEGNSMRSSNPHSGIYEADTSRTLDKAGGNPSCNQGGIAVVSEVYTLDSLGANSMKSGNPDSGCRQSDIAETITTCSPSPGGRGGNAVVTYAIEGNGSRPSHRGTGIGKDVSFTLNSVERHAVSYGIDRGAYNQGKNAQYKPQFTEECITTLVSRGPSAVCNNYIVRRLTPTECALLQGFPHDWCECLETPEPTEEDILFWSEVWETHRLSIGKSSRPKSRKQIIKWLESPHSDSAEYKMWGNGVALPCVIFVLGGIAHYVG